jgi:hypothetical protein
VLPFCGDPGVVPPCSIVPVGPNPGPTQYGEIQAPPPARPYWDLAVLGGSGQFNPSSSVLTFSNGPANATGYLAGNHNVTYAGSNLTETPAFVSFYFNTDRRHAYQVGETNGEATLISTPAALDEGGNFIRPQFGPLSLWNPTENKFFGNYHVNPPGVGGQALCGSGSVFGGSCNSTNSPVPDALLFDFDHQPRPTGAPDRGADETDASLAVPTTPVPQR